MQRKMYVVSQKLKTANFTFMLKTPQIDSLLSGRILPRKKLILMRMALHFGELVGKMIHPFMSNFCDALKKYRTRSFLFIKLT